MACWVSLRSARFAASIAGDDITGLQREPRIKDESCAITLAVKTHGARTTLLDKTPNIMDTSEYAFTHTSNDLLFSLDRASLVSPFDEVPKQA